MFEKARTHETSADHDDLVTAFLSVRRFLGFLGLLLPLALYAAAYASGEMQSSISGFYHTFMGDVLVGILVAIGAFLIAYVGHSPKHGEKLTDWAVSTLAGVGAIGVAIFPTVPADADCAAFEPPTIIQGVVLHWCQWWGVIHFASAGLFFVCMAYFCLALFPKKANGKVRYETAGDTTYKICGLALLFAILALAAVAFFKDTSFVQTLLENNIVFWLETLGVLAFAIAWLTKGNTLGGIANLVEGRAANAKDDPAANDRALTQP